MSHICEEEGCKEKATVNCFLLDSDLNGQPDYTYCCEHAKQDGFCMGCGQFCAGMESFDFHHPGWCDNCYDQISEDDDDGDWNEYEGHIFDDEDDDSKDPNDSRNP